MVHFCSQITLIRNFGAPFSWRPPATPGQPGLRYATDGNGFISFSVKHMILSLGRDSPCSVFMKNDFILRGDDSVKVRNIDYSKTIQPTFLYCNIVENSYINGKLSRNLSTIPLSMKAGLNCYEFSNPAYVPIDVKEFSKIIIQLRDMDGKTIQFDPDYRTIINLHIKPINTAPQ